MAINFPNAPSIGDQYTFAGRVWEWNGTVWLAQGVATLAWSVLGRAADTDGPVNAITADTEGQVLILRANVLGFGRLTAADMEDGAVTKTATTGAANTPAGTTAQRPGSPVDGQIRWNSDLGALEHFDGSVWAPLGSGGPALGADSVIRFNAPEIAEDITVRDNPQTVTADAGADTLSATAHGFENGDRVQIESTGTVPGGLSAGTDYYVVNATADTLKVSATRGGSAIDITSAGTGTITLYKPVNAFSGGPMTIADGFTVTVASGSEWGIV